LLGREHPLVGLLDWLAVNATLNRVTSPDLNVPLSDA
jgi:hypothetical protein